MGVVRGHFSSYFYLGKIFCFDLVRLIFIIFSILISFLIFISRVKEINGVKGKLYSLIMVFLVVNLLYVFLINSFIYFYFIFEISLIPIFLIITGWGYQPERLQAGFYMFIYTLVGSLPFLYCLIKINGGIGGFFMKNLGLDLGYLGSLFGLAFVIVFMVKFPIFFVHL